MTKSSAEQSIHFIFLICKHYYFSLLLGPSSDRTTSMADSLALVEEVNIGGSGKILRKFLIF